MFAKKYALDAVTGNYGATASIWDTPRYYIHLFHPSKNPHRFGASVVTGASLTCETEGPISEELADGGVGSNDQGKANDNAEWNQFWWNLLERPDALRDGVGAVFLFRHRRHGPTSGPHVEEASLHVDNA